MIQVKDLHKGFNGQEVLKGIDYQFERGKTNLIIGQSGSGKSVFLKCMLGLFKPDQGAIEYDGKPYSNFSDEETDKVIDLAESYLYTTTLEDFVKDNFSYCPECDMKWQEIKEHCYTEGSEYTKDKDLVKAIKMIIPVGKESKIRKNGGYNFWCVKKGKQRSHEFVNAGDGLPF